MQHARLAVDLLSARRRDLDERQRTEQARSEQVTRWQREDQRNQDSADTTSTTTGARAIYGRGLHR